MPVTIRDIAANGFSFRCRESGPAAGEPVILLHGFPETSHMWIPLLERLEAEGYHAVTPDQRGYSPGARPEGSEHYRYQDTASDVIAIADALGFGTFHLVGHDWGAGCGWAVVDLHPERIRSWSALSVPHIGAFGRAIRDDPDQQQRSQYITFFQEPGVAEAALSANDYAGLKAVWSASSEEEKAEYVSVFEQPGALTAALNWYRGSAGIDPTASASAGVAFAEVTTPTLFIWGNQDGAIGRTGVEAGHALMKGPYKFVELDAGHWLIQEQPARVIDEVVGHLRANAIA